MTNKTDKEFLKISDMVAKLGVTRTQFWKMRKAGEVPPPVIKNPQMWLATKVMEFYENRASREYSSFGSFVEYGRHSSIFFLNAKKNVMHG